jgi:hypothetical protein
MLKKHKTTQPPSSNTYRGRRWKGEGKMMGRFLVGVGGSRILRKRQKENPAGLLRGF